MMAFETCLEDSPITGRQGLRMDDVALVHIIDDDLLLRDAIGELLSSVPRKQKIRVRAPISFDGRPGHARMYPA